MGEIVDSSILSFLIRLDIAQIKYNKVYIGIIKYKRVVREKGMYIRYGYQLIDNSPWVLYTSISIFSIMISTLAALNKYEYGGYILIITIISLFINISYWGGEVIKEGSIKGEHTEIVQQGLNKGFILFLISEIFVFFTLFYSFFYSALIPDIHLAGIWPPIGIISIDYKSIPLLNTALLFFSGITITIAQYRIKEGNEKESKKYLIYTITLGLIFIYLQYIEYAYSLFTLTDSIFGNLFFALTSFHGFHVLMGLIFIFTAYIRLNEISISHHLNFIFSSIYFHLVDAVWLFLYAILYIWSSGLL